MKHSTRASDSKPLTNPTPTKATVYQYTAIGLCVLIHLLDDHPEHIRYRENEKARASGLPGKSAKPGSGRSHAPSRPPLSQRDHQPHEHRREERPRYEASVPRPRRDYQARPLKREEYQPRYEVPPPLPRQPSDSKLPPRLFTRPGPTPLTHRPRPPTPPLPRRPSHSELPTQLFTRPNTTHPVHQATPPPPFPCHHPPLPRHPGAPPPPPPRSPISPHTHNHPPSRHQAWTRIRSVTPRKKVKWGGVEVLGHDGEAGEAAGGEQEDRQRRPRRREKEPWGAVDDGDIWGPREGGEVVGA